MNSPSIRPLWLLGFLGALALPPLLRGDDSAAWSKEKAGEYLDGRAKAWFEFPGAGRGEGLTRTCCVSCHTLLPYALARPVLRRMAGAGRPTEYEQKLLAQTRLRVERWADLDGAKLGLLYDFSARKKRESWGTEAVLNAVVLAFDDRRRGRKEPGEATRRAFANLWGVQAAAGDDRGSWDWLDFGLEPWEARAARYHGAALAAIAVGTAPGYLAKGGDKAASAKVGLLRDYLRRRAAEQGLLNRAWALWASARLDGVLTEGERKKAVGQLLEKQREDGGWSLPSLGAFARSDGTAQDPGSDGYATGLVLHALQEAGVAKIEPAVARGLAWLRRSQGAAGAWRCVSVNKRRDPATHVGTFMTDAATAYAVLALGH